MLWCSDWIEIVVIQRWTGYKKNKWALKLQSRNLRVFSYLIIQSQIHFLSISTSYWSFIINERNKIKKIQIIFTSKATNHVIFLIFASFLSNFCDYSTTFCEIFSIDYYTSKKTYFIPILLAEKHYLRTSLHSKYFYPVNPGLFQNLVLFIVLHQYEHRFDILQEKMQWKRLCAQRRQPPHQQFWYFDQSALSTISLMFDRNRNRTLLHMSGKVPDTTRPEYVCSPRIDDHG